MARYTKRTTPLPTAISLFKFLKQHGSRVQVWQFAPTERPFLLPTFYDHLNNTVRPFVELDTWFSILRSSIIYDHKVTYLHKLPTASRHQKSPGLG